MRANLTITIGHWTGSERAQPAPESRHFAGQPGETVTGRALGLGDDSIEISVGSVSADAVALTYRGVVKENDNGTISFFAPRTGEWTLRPGGTLHLATATMDAGTRISVTLDAVD